MYFFKFLLINPYPNMAILIANAFLKKSIPKNAP